jgi:hypothetical protein
VHRHSTVRLQFVGGLLTTTVSAATAVSFVAFVTSVRISSKAWTNRLKKTNVKISKKDLIRALSEDEDLESSQQKKKKQKEKTKNDEEKV